MGKSGFLVPAEKVEFWIFEKMKTWFVFGSRLRFGVLDYGFMLTGWAKNRYVLYSWPR